jgi:hypothetical protein
MSIDRRIFVSFVVSVVFLFASIAANAQTTRSWVSGVGDDVNPCSRTAPCKTFAGAISKTATGGEINCLDPAGFGAVTITKSITIDCEDTQGSILSAGTNGVIINIADNDSKGKAVNLRGISINGAGTGLNGIKIVAAGSVTIEDVVINGCTAAGITAESGQIFVRNSSIRNTLTAINAIGGATFRLDGNLITANRIGLSAATGGSIISFKTNAIDGNGTNGSPTSAVPQQ